MESIQQQICSQTRLKGWQVENALKLFSEGATVPFVSRYRKEATGSLDEVQLQEIKDLQKRLTELEDRRRVILESIKSQGKLNPELERQLLEADTMARLEDLYLPYRPKRRTKATIARERGLEPLAKILMAQHDTAPQKAALRFVNPGKDVPDTEKALEGARDIIAEWANEDPSARTRMRKLFQREGTVSTRLSKGKETEGAKYRDYFDFEEKISRAPSHRMLAMRRGENEGILKLKIEAPKAEAETLLERKFIRGNSPCAREISKALEDGYKRLMQPSMETEFRKTTKEKADAEAIQVFADNLRQLLMAPPLGQKRVLAIDPGFRTGCKVVALDAQGNLKFNGTIFPHPPQNEKSRAAQDILEWVRKYNIEAIAVGNGTAGRETESFLKNCLKESGIPVIMVNESGASIYSASEVARREFPDKDVTVRGAISIGRRLTDPLAELVKIDPKSIGVGQYQHDVDQKALKEKLDQVVEACVNAIGVNLNTASRELLTYVSGLGPSLAENIVEYRRKNGAFSSRSELKKVPRLGAKAFEQSAGFLRIPGTKNPLDNSAVHPESYGLVKQMAASLGVKLNELIGNSELVKTIQPEQFVSEKAGLPTIKDILRELEKPGRDPRESFEVFSFAEGIHSPEDLHKGMILPGIVTNITKFGAFVDIGVHQDGLIHVSEMANKYISDPSTIVKVNQQLQVKVLEVDLKRNRISLSLKQARN